MDHIQQIKVEIQKLRVEVSAINHSLLLIASVLINKSGSDASVPLSNVVRDYHEILAQIRDKPETIE